MEWLTKAADELEQRRPDGEIIVSSGVSPSGTYHLGTLREVLTAEALLRELKMRDRQVRHLHIVDDLDVFRKVPTGLPTNYEQYLGQPLCDIPSPADKNQSYADYYLNDLLSAAKDLGLEIEVVRAHELYRAGFFEVAIEKALDHAEQIAEILATISGHKVGEDWSPVQINEDGYLKNRHFVSIDPAVKIIKYLDQAGAEQSVSYAKGDVKLNWRIDWPARWWLLKVDAEPFGRDHATKGGSYDTGAAIIKAIFKAKPPLPLPYAFINRTGDTKKMSKSAGDTVTAAELLEILPPEVVWYFILRYPPSKQLFFDQGPTLIRLIDDYAALQAKAKKTPSEEHLLALCSGAQPTSISSLPFSYLVDSYQAALKDPKETLAVVSRKEYAKPAKEQASIITKELAYIDQWLNKWAPEELKFSLVDKVEPGDFSDEQKTYLSQLADSIAKLPADADGDDFHKAIYELSQASNLKPAEAFGPIYQAIINQDHGPRAGWFLSILPRDWLVKRLKLEA